MGIIPKKVTLSLLLVAMVLMATFVPSAVGECQTGTANDGSVAATGKKLSLLRSVLKELEPRENGGPCIGSLCSGSCSAGCTCLKPSDFPIGICV
ncbi:hypothetical protein FNV43_RR10395 [Rhamnella rubrinervis]|uniref:Uncharacterized protein n=1 Tax=Rhamnella rubrinervis TaxID=2594499 RepID=A0A8K0MKU2_9ROSA|nr:hypothetical protein FNV43_RR09676 [Rhamnella rubrinervis]KAF3448958.1 hypothetical protein FNV43_RR09678 [Rhamnella rubrinervis]KAF3449662.1 hypothetical protein FNV43_RR10393 [Rhamnella rubrinervis]KAF3449664.1 hypothetical protein FNV43_RR10395 [Rhamnella rubrinervis]